MKFSLTIPAYKSRYLAETIESILSQTYKDFELIIVDDCSPEDLWSVVSRFDDKRIRYYRNETNCGSVNVVDNWNICLGYCRGDYVICVGDDDRLLPCCLEEYAKLISKYPRLAVYHAWAELIDENSEFLSITMPRTEYESCMSLLWNRWNSYSNQYIGDFCYDVNQLRLDGGYYKLPMAWASDDISAVRAARIGGIANTQVLCFQYRQSKYTISSIGAAKVKAEALLMEYNWYNGFLNKYVPDVDTTDEKFYLSVKNEFDQRFRDKFKGLLASDMKDNPLHLFYWLGKHTQYHLSIIRVLYAFKVGFEMRFHGV